MFIAERQGFEPRVPRSTTVFKTAAIDHSATSPKCPFYFSIKAYIISSSELKQKCLLLKAVQRYKEILNLQMIL